MARFPADSESRQTDTRACAIVHYQIDPEHWDYKVETGHDVGCDCILELAEKGFWRGSRIRVQIKGTKNLERYLLSNKRDLSFPLEAKTIGYALNGTDPFVLMLVDIASERVFFEEIHLHFLANPKLRDKLDSGQQKISIRIPTSQQLGTETDADLQAIAKKSFVQDANDWFYEAQ